MSETNIERAKELLKEAQTLLGKDSVRSLQLAKESFSCVHPQGDLFLQVQSLVVLCKSLVYLGKLQPAQENAEQVLSIISKQKYGFDTEKADAYLCLGNIYYYQGYYTEALKTISENTIEKNRGISQLQLAKSLSLKGHIHCRLDHYADAFNDFQQSLEIKDKLGVEGEGMANSIMNIALVYLEMDDVDKALHYIDKAAIYLDESMIYTYCINVMNKGVVLGRKGCIEDANEQFSKALQLCETHQLDRLKASVVSNMGEFYFLSGDVDKSLSYAQLGVVICNENDLKNNIFATCMLTVFRCHTASYNLEAAAEIGRDCIPLFKETGYTNLTVKN